MLYLNRKKKGSRTETRPGLQPAHDGAVLAPTAKSAVTVIGSQSPESGLPLTFVKTEP